jgi:hypothetical protein
MSLPCPSSISAHPIKSTNFPEEPKKLTQLEDNLASAKVELSADDLKSLNEASAITLGFPNNFFALPMVQTFVYGGLKDRIKNRV